MFSTFIRSAGVAATFLCSIPFAFSQSDSPPSTVSTSIGDITVEDMATLEFPWGMALLPDDRLLITEKPGRLRIWNQGNLSGPIKGVPDVVFRGSQSDQGGLLDVAVDPDFEDNNYIYLSYVEASEEQPENIRDTGDARFAGNLDLSDDIVRGGVVARAELRGNRLRNLKVIWRQFPTAVGRGHFGHRLIFASDNTLYITSGDRMRFDPAQDLSTNLGKILRINTDGSTPDDNPFAGEDDKRNDIWTYGHRNILAAAIDSDSERLWAFEMGPLGGDEVNLIEKGKDYGWPSVSNGSDYGGQTIPGHPAKPDEYEAPVRTWTPVISPSGALFYQGSLFEQWQGDALVGGLSSKAIVRLELDEDRIAVEERINMQRRIRDLIEMPDGSIYALVDAEEGALLRLAPTD